jgi:hypothetical protein
MRAFMSTGGRRRYKGTGEIFAGITPQRSTKELMATAEREAKRILAETEPREDRGSVSWPTIGSLVYWQRVCARKPQTRPLWRDQNAATLALTDALRAFVEGE